MDNPDYYELYPETRLNGKRVSTDLQGTVF